jgi:hypothetical protein
LDPRQLQVKRRCTLAHELEHIRRGQCGCQGPRMEAAVRQTAAVYLTLTPYLVAYVLVLAQGDLWQAADTLQLDHATLQYKGLTVIPETMGNLTALTALDVSSNQLTAVLETIGSLTALTALSLQANELTTVPETIG